MKNEFDANRAFVAPAHKTYNGLDAYTADANKRTLAARLVRSLAVTRRSQYTNQGADPRNTADSWYWTALVVLIPLAS